MDLRDEIEALQRQVAILQEENRELLADREALLRLCAELREGGSPSDEPVPE